MTTEELTALWQRRVAAATEQIDVDGVLHIAKPRVIMLDDVQMRTRQSTVRSSQVVADADTLRSALSNARAGQQKFSSSMKNVFPRRAMVVPDFALTANSETSAAELKPMVESAIANAQFDSIIAQALTKKQVEKRWKIPNTQTTVTITRCRKHTVSPGHLCCGMFSIGGDTWTQMNLAIGLRQYQCI